MFISKKNKVKQPIKFHDFWEIDNQQVTSSYQKLWSRIEQITPLKLPQPAFNWWKLTSLAASIALLIVSGIYWLLTPEVEHQVEIVYVTDNGSQLTLSDGTKVWLSANSQLRYQQTFTGKTRDVSLKGEAYFEVAHNRKQLFRVLAGGQTVVALGTSFNVRAYTDEQDVKVILVEGSVRVTDDKSGQEVVLKPAQEATIDKSIGLINIAENKPLQVEENHIQETESVKAAGSIAVKEVDIDGLMSWKTGRYVFYNMTFEEITKMLEKGFKVTIHIENEELKSKPYTMRFENGESLENILDLIQVNARYSYRYVNGVVVIQ